MGKIKNKKKLNKSSTTRVLNNLRLKTERLKVPKSKTCNDTLLFLLWIDCNMGSKIRVGGTLSTVPPHTRCGEGRGSPLTPKVFLLGGLAAPSPKQFILGGTEPFNASRENKRWPNGHRLEPV